MQHLIITGGAGGIGTHLSRALVDDGFKVLVIGRDPAKFDQLYEDIKRNENLEFFKVDVTSIHNVSDFFRSITGSKYQLFALINCAGVQTPIGKFSEIDMEAWANNISVNLLGTSNMIKASVPFLSNLTIVDFAEPTGPCNKTTLFSVPYPNDADFITLTRRINGISNPKTASLPLSIGSSKKL